MSDFPPIAFVVPHQGPMVLLDRIVDWAPGKIECALRVQEGARFVEDGRLEAPFTIEHMAQAVAAYYVACKEEAAWPGERLIPLLVVLDDLIPWLKRWFNEIDPFLGTGMGDYFESFLEDELKALGFTRETLKSWRPPQGNRSYSQA